MSQWLPYLRLGYHAIVAPQMRYKRVIAMLSEQGDTPLSASDCQRIRTYLSIQALTMRWFASWSNHRVTQKEREAGDLLAALTPLYDDLIDEDGFNHSDIESSQALNGRIRLAQKVLKQLEARLVLTEEFKEYLHLLSIAQEESKKQERGDTLSIEEIDSISDRKGAYSTLLYRTVLSNPIGEEERDCIYHLGASLQVLNDIFDLYKDLQKGKHTRATLCQSAQELKNHYYHMVGQVVDKLRNKLALSNSQLSEVLLVLCRGHVALEQYTKLEEQYGKWSPRDWSRQQVIVDMEQWKNICSVAYYTNLYL